MWLTKGHPVSHNLSGKWAYLFTCTQLQVSGQLNASPQLIVPGFAARPGIHLIRSIKTYLAIQGITCLEGLTTNVNTGASLHNTHLMLDYWQKSKPFGSIHYCIIQPQPHHTNDTYFLWHSIFPRAMTTWNWGNNWCHMWPFRVSLSGMSYNMWCVESRITTGTHPSTTDFAYPNRLFFPSQDWSDQQWTHLCLQNLIKQKNEWKWLVVKDPFIHPSTISAS